MGEGLRIVTFNVFPPAYRVVAEWAARHEHRLALLVTVPSRHSERYDSDYPPLLDMLPRDLGVLITTRMRRTAAPVIAALQPDLVISASFPLRIPPEITSVPRLGAVNVHPSPLPRGRGPNPARAVYQGDATIGCTLHRIEPEFDAGAILSRRERPRPADLAAGDLFRHWMELAELVVEEGTRRAIAGEWGEAQDECEVTHWPEFSDEERLLSWSEDAATVQRRVAALNALAPTARAVVEGCAVVVLDACALPQPAPPAAPGTVLARNGEVALVRVADGVVSVRAKPDR